MHYYIVLPCYNKGVHLGIIVLNYSFEKHSIFVKQRQTDRRHYVITRVVAMCFSALSDQSIPLTHMAVVDNEGTVDWIPPVVLETDCSIDMSFFPFDKQTCYIKFGSWTYSGEKVSVLSC